MASSWEAFDSFQQHSALPQFPEGPFALNTAWQGGPSTLQFTTTTPTQSPLSLDRYLQLLELLCRPDPSTPRLLRVRQLSELERAAVKVEDLKNVLALNGRVPTGKNKQDLLDKMRGMILVAPTCCIPSSSSSPLPPTAPQPPTQLLQGIERALDWGSTLTPAQRNSISTDIARQGFYSHCPLPPHPAFDTTTQAMVRSMDAAVPEPAASTATTIASQPPILHAHVAQSPSSSPLPPLLDTRDAIMTEVVTQEHHHHHHNSYESYDPPEWLRSSLEILTADCQGSTGDDAQSVVGPALVGKKVALVLCEDFVQDGGNDDGVDIVEKGVHLGQVVEWIGCAHDEDSCAVDCSEEHRFCFVRVAPTKSSSSSSRSTSKHRRARRRLDLAVDLREEFRVDALEDLLYVDGERLMDAWVLVEPRED